ncbi:Conserved secreted protein [Caenorhabditis elegans]|uniref:Conserved secreted protein n=1 Tax=Caenorhabditis elegans TaxID=6239 RepID=Q2V4S8_CAEEL|nr:Conserved secreted protein [Caenorhabditis elegans]CCD70473.1 Conserved secreted protein [Caenorhabditis elegans]|eukprot:NP_001040784.2 Uncharacterized protein CELE_F59A6.11 [Caenorhabditis elegans]
MKFICFLACFFTLAFANCEDDDTCFCPDIRSEHYREYGGHWQSEEPDDRLTSSEGPGCIRNLTCMLSFDTYFSSGFQWSNIPVPADSAGSLWVHAQKPGSTPPGSFADLQELFGIICEDLKWKITKFPYGYVYMQKDTFEHVHVDASKIVGKSYKVELKTFYCDGELHDIEYFKNLGK